MERNGGFRLTVTVCVLIAALCGSAHAQYGGGTGTPDDPYLIYTPEQMNAIGADPNDWDKHFKLMADLDLAQYTGTEFNLIGYPQLRRRTPAPPGFTGVFDGRGHTISNFSYVSEGEHYVGLFRYVDDPNAEIRSLRLVGAQVDAGWGAHVGALVGRLAYGTITDCRSEAIVRGSDHVGGLAGSGGMLTGCCSNSIVVGIDHNVGWDGGGYVGGLVGNADAITNCCARGIVIGDEYVGGLAGEAGSVTNCYATALVKGTSHVGGLIGPQPYEAGTYEHVIGSFWDVQTSRQETSAGGMGRTTAEMQQLVTFFTWGQENNAGVWTIDEGNDYPRLAWEDRPGVVIEPTPFGELLAGMGTPDDPYKIYTAAEMDLVGQSSDQWDKHYKLMADLDLSSYADTEFHLIGDREIPFEGVFEGDGHTISNFTYVSDEDIYVGLFAYVQLDPCLERRYCDPAESAVITNLGLVNPEINGGAWGMRGALVGYLSSGTVTNCYVEGGCVSIRNYSENPVGGLVGYCRGSATIAGCYANTVVAGGGRAGGLVGYCYEATIKNCYAQGVVIGLEGAGGLAGGIVDHATVTNCYSSAVVIGASDAGGLAGFGWYQGAVTGCFWDVEASAQTTSPGGVGLTTDQMQTAATFLAARWDFVGEGENGTEEIWWIDEGADYPRLWWERREGEF
jgi:The GLUG motif